VPTVRVQWLKGRTEKQRLKLVEKITSAVSEVALVPPTSVTVIFDEISPEMQFKGGVQLEKPKAPKEG